MGIAAFFWEWAALVRYIDIGEAEIDNNGIERLLRGVALGRKNFLHFDRLRLADSYPEPLQMPERLPE